MLRKQNQDLVIVLFFYANRLIRQVYHSQLAAFFLSTLFVTLHISNNQKYGLFFPLLWVSFELIVLMIAMKLNKQKLKREKIVSFECKQRVISAMQSYASLRYIKFLGLLCNFLGVVGGVKSMRVYQSMDWSIIICLISLLASYLLLKASSDLQTQLAKCLDIYNNFKIILEPQLEKELDMVMVSDE